MAMTGTSAPDPRQGGSLGLVVFSDEFGRVHYALMIAAAAAAIARPTTLFFAGPAVGVLARRAADRNPGWHDLRSPGGAAAADAALASQGIATIEALLEACRDIGVRFIACETALAAASLSQPDLRSDLRVEIAGIITLLAGVGRDGQLLFV